MTAPGDLRLVQEFVNSCEIDAGTDELATVEGLAKWLCERFSTVESVEVTERQRRQAVELREGLRELLSANAGAEGDRKRLATMERTLEKLALRCSLAESARFELVATGEGWPRVAARLLTMVIRAMADGTWSRLKVCHRDDCRWAFFDTSKNRSGKWCSMTGCGDLMKARAYRRRLNQRNKGGRE